MAEQLRYTSVCHRHKVHDEECTACRTFDKALKEKLNSYTTPPERHPVVIASQTREWIGRIFPIVKS